MLLQMTHLSSAMMINVSGVLYVNGIQRGESSQWSPEQMYFQLLLEVVGDRAVRMDTHRLFYAHAAATGNTQLFDFVQNVLQNSRKKMKMKQISRTDDEDDCDDDDVCDKDADSSDVDL